MGMLKEYARLALGIGAAGALGSLILLAWVPDLKTFSLPSLIISAVLSFLGAVITLRGLGGALFSRQNRLGGAVIATAIAVVLLLVLANMLAALVDISWDLTATEQYEIAPQTIQVVSELKEPVYAIAFAKTDDHSFRNRARNYLKQMRAASREHFDFRFVDPELQPSIARRVRAKDFPAIVFISDRTGLSSAVGAADLSEQSLVAALRTTSGIPRHNIYIVDGHGERRVTDLREDGLGIGFMAQGLKDSGYRVEQLPLYRIERIPDDAHLLIFAGSTAEFPTQEEAIVQNWLARGGKGLFMLDAYPGPTSSIARILAKWGVDVVEGEIVDKQRSAAGDHRTLVVQSDQYPGGTAITRGTVIQEPLGPTIFPGAIGFRPSAEVLRRREQDLPLPVRYSPVVVSSPSSFASNIDSDDSEELIRGSIAIHLILQATSAVTKDGRSDFDPNRIETTIAMIGDTDFATNQYLDKLSNRDLILNTVSWLLDDNTLVSIRPNEQVFRPLILTTGEYDLIRFISWFLVPFSLIITAIVTWWRRR